MEQEIIELLMSTKRDGIEEFIEEMKLNGFFKSSCSGGNHLCKEGGLAEHSLNVCHNAMKIADTLGYKNMESVVIVSLLHDYGKTGDYGKELYVANILKSGKASTAKPYKRNPEILEKNHAIKSAIQINRFFNLTEEEEFAILHHDGLYEVMNKEAWQNPTELLMILHWADLWASRVIEAGQDDDED